MKLWHLYPNPDRPKENDPWEPWYDKAFGFIIRAAAAQEAREMIKREVQTVFNYTSWPGDEAEHCEDQDGNYDNSSSPWRDPKLTVCDELTTDGEACVIMKDFHAA